MRLVDEVNDFAEWRKAVGNAPLTLGRICDLEDSKAENWHLDAVV
jgi:hypothetical protein